MLYPRPQDNAAFTWVDSSVDPPKDAVFVGMGVINDPNNVYGETWVYKLYEVATVPTRSYTLVVKKSPGVGHTVSYIFTSLDKGVAGAIATYLNFVPTDENTPIVGGDCASQRACERIINGQKVCVPWDKKAYAAYGVKVALICLAGATGGALGAHLAKKKSPRAQRNHILGGFAGAALGCALLYAIGVLRPRRVCES